jgi:hypothetical protein
MEQHDSKQATRIPDRTDSNGAPAAAAGDGRSGTPSAEDVAAEERLRRAEEMVDRMAHRIGEAAGRLGHGLLRLAARAREEAEDIWAEARSLSRGERS